MIKKMISVYRKAPRTEEPMCKHNGEECRLLACNVGCKYMEDDEDGFVCNRYCKWITPAYENGEWIQGTGKLNAF